MAPTVKYNPGFLTDDELVQGFCVRVLEMQTLLQSIAECDGSSNMHQLVVGPRGSGKTSLLLRVAVELRRHRDLSTRFLPVVFAEESYEVATSGEFWLEAVYRISQLPELAADAPDLTRTYDTLRAERNDQVLADRCLGALLDFADRAGRRLVLIVENINMLLSDMSDPANEGWRIRKILQTEPRLVLLASSTSRFDAIDQPDQAFFDFFRVTHLPRLGTEECAALWRTVAGKDAPPATIRSLEILTGGSPRLISIVARFGANLSFQELMDDLLDLIDDHTDYFKSHLEALPPQERRVYLALADLWRPATAREIADRARLDTSTASAQLKRLEGRGVISHVGGTPRRKEYYLSERLYNIYYILRRHRGVDRMVEALIAFMTAFYTEDALVDIGIRIGVEANALEAKARGRHIAALSNLVRSSTSGSLRERMLENIPDAVAQQLAPAMQSSAALARARGAEVPGGQQRSDVPDREVDISSDGGVADERAAAAYDAVVERFGAREEAALAEYVARALVYKGVTLGELGRDDDALAAYDAVVERFGAREEAALAEQVAQVLVYKGVTLGRLGRDDDALAAYEAVVDRFGAREEAALAEQVAGTLINKGVALARLGRDDDALAAYDDVVERFGAREETALAERVAWALINRDYELEKRGDASESTRSREEMACLFDADQVCTFAASFASNEAESAAELRERGLIDRAIDAASRALFLPETRNSEAALAALRERGLAHIDGGRESEGVAHVNDLLDRVGDEPSLLSGAIGALIEFAAALGPTPIIAAIENHATSSSLLPLEIALRLDAGEEPRVAREVMEVAADIRARLEERRMKNGRTSADRNDGRGKR